MKNVWIQLVAITSIACGGTLSAALPAIISTETRTYDIFVDRARVGQSTLTITRYGDGSEVATTDAKVTVGWTVFKYVYEYHGQERWHAGRLEELSSQATDGGSRLSLIAARGEHGLLLKRSSGSAETIADVQLTTNYWREPVAHRAASALNILDADNGKTYEAKLERLGQKELTLADRRITCTGLRLTGGVDAELWFDPAGFLVRQTGTEDGHQTELRLVAIQQPSAALAGTSR